jgi:hypothetical protein
MTCVGDPSLANEDEDDERKHYKFVDLPANTAIFIFTSAIVDIKLSYSLCNVTVDDIINFVDALKTNNKCSICTRPGANQDASISTSEGITTFCFFGAGGDNPTEFNIKIPNENVLDAFESLL